MSRCAVLTMLMIIKCGDSECREEFKTGSEEPSWECPACGRVILNKNYPFLTAKLMQARIDGGENDWKATFQDLLEKARMEVVKRTEGEDRVVDLSFLEEGDDELSKDHTNEEWRVKHDELLQKGREVVLELDIKEQ